MKRKSYLLLSVVLVMFLGVVQGQQLYLTYDGVPLSGIVIHENANQTIEQAASELKYYLQKMSGADIGIKKTNTVGMGIILTLKEQFSFPNLAVKLEDASADGFIIKCDPENKMLILMGNTPEALSYAVYTLLENFGSRWFFPGEVWEEIPQQKTIAINAFERVYDPSYGLRKIWYGWGIGPIPENAAAYNKWCAANKMDGWLTGSVGHAYAKIVPKSEFDAHPDWFALVNGVRTSAQLCTTHPQVVQRAIKYAKDFYSKSTDIMVSLSPNDGYNMCECDNCQSLGNDSDKALYLANEVAKAIREEYPERLVAMYAYAPTSAPPLNVVAEPNVIIYIATAFTDRNLKLDQIVDGWSLKAQKLGMREYYSLGEYVPTWKIDYLDNTVNYFHQRGAIGITAESLNNWGTMGVNYYVASKLLWNHELSGMDVYEDFISKCWQEAAVPMRRFYLRFKDGFNSRVFYQALLDLKEADELAQSENVKKRLEQMKLFVHWLGLFQDYGQATGDSKQELLNELYVLTMQIAKNNFVHSYGIYRDGRGIGFPKDFQPTLPEGYKDPMDLANRFPGFSSDQINQFFLDVLSRVQEIPEIEEYLYSHERCFYPRELDAQRRGIFTKKSDSPMYRGTNIFYLYSDSEGEIDLQFGLIRQNSLRYKLERVLVEDTVIVEEGITEPDEKEKPLSLPERGTYKLTIDGRGMATKINFKDAYAMVSFERNEQPHIISGTRGGPLFFYIPKETEAFAFGWKTPDGQGRILIKDKNGKVLLDERGDYRGGEEFVVPVPSELRGSICSLEITNCEDAENLYLLGLPPFLSHDPVKLLIPKDVGY